MGQDTGVAAVMASMDCEAAVWYREAMEAPSFTMHLSTLSHNSDVQSLEAPGVVPGGEVYRLPQDGLDVGLWACPVLVTGYPINILQVIIMYILY